MSSKFNVYAQKVNDIAKQNFSAYRSAETNYKLAEEAMENHPEGRGGSPEYQAKAAQLKAEFLSAQSKLNEARAKLEKSMDDVKKIQKELEREVNSTFGADPSAVDLPTMELIKSGILTASDYVRLIEKAKTDNNITMLKIIAKNAVAFAKELESQDELKARELRQAALAAQSVSGKAYIDAFDMLTDVYYRCTNNPYMIQNWEQLTARAIESF